MLETIAIILIVPWILGLVSSYTMGGLIHALLVIAIVVILIRVHSRPANLTKPTGKKESNDEKNHLACIGCCRDASG